jgi:predicted secreted protein
MTNMEDPMRYRKTVLLIIVLPLFFASCAQQQTKTPKEVSIAWSEISQGVGLEVGDILEVVLPANRSTGYDWEVGFYNQSVLEPYGEPEFSSASANLGAEESERLHFEAIGAGETQLTLVYQRPFENEEGDQQIFEIKVVVE